MTFQRGDSSDIKIPTAENEKNNDLWHCKSIFQDYKAETFTLNVKKSIHPANSLLTASCDHIHDHDYDLYLTTAWPKKWLFWPQEQIDLSQNK